jgi:ATP-dependent Clp protease ATP-binding subunit ClpA
MPQTIDRPFTSRTYVSLAIARGIAAANGHTDLTACHVALGFLREGENPAVAALHHAGVSLTALRHDLERTLPQRGRPQFGEVLLPVTPGEREIVEVARAEAVSQNDEYLGNEHLLLALLRYPDSAAGQVFSRHGFTYETAADHLRAVLVGHGVTCANPSSGDLCASH